MPEATKSPAIEPISVSVSDAAKALGMSRYKCYEAIKAGELDARWNGRQYLIPVAALPAYLDSLPTEKSA